MPPWDEVADALQYTMLLPFAVSGAVYFVFTFLRLPRPGLVIALVAGFLTANGERDAAAFRIDSDEPLTVNQFCDAATATLAPSKAIAPVIPASRYWLPWSILIAALVGLLADSARVPMAIRLALRIATAIIAARLFVSPERRIDDAGLWPVLALLIFANWYLLERMLREHPGIVTSLIVVIAFNLAGLVLLYAHSIRLNDIAVIIGSGFLAVAIIAWWRTRDVRGIAPILAVLLPGLMLIGDGTQTSEVPRTSFVLVAVSPLLLSVLAVFKMLRCTHRRCVWLSLVLFLLPSTVAVFLAARVESLSID